MTVGELRRAMEGVPDTQDVSICSRDSLVFHDVLQASFEPGRRQAWELVLEIGPIVVPVEAP